MYTLDQDNPDMNHKLWRYTPYADAADMVQHINGKFII
jgi:hypothetical protein